MKKIAVIFGGFGFIGSHLARSLVRSGEYQRVVCADIAATPRFVTEGVEYIFCDVRNEIPADLVSGATEIYNLAAVHTTPGHDDWEYFWTNILGATRVCDYARRANIPTLVFTSSISVYGTSEEPLTENSPLHPESAYGRSKFCAETIHRLWRDEDGATRKLIIARPAVIFGFMEKGNFTRLAGLLKKGLVFFPGRRDTIKACGYVKDLVNSFAFFLKSNADCITYNFAYTERYTVEQIADAFCACKGYKALRILVPFRLLMLAAIGGEVLNAVGLKNPVNRARIRKLRFATNVVPEKLDQSGFVRAFPLPKALNDWSMESGADFK